MLIVLFVLCLILLFWVTKLSSTIEEIRKATEYNFQVYNQKFKDAEEASKMDQEQIEHLLDRIHDLEKVNPN